MRSWFALILLVAIAGRPSQTRAEPTQTKQPRTLQLRRTSNPTSLSQYERDILATVLKERQLTLEPHPEGKLVEAVEIEPLDVFEAADPAPGWLNWFHVTTRSSVIEREILLRTGQTYDQRLVDESARNLRKIKQLSLVLILPVQTRDPKLIRLLVITKDVWSLRLDTAYSSRNYGIEHLALQPSEINLFGTHLAVAGRYEYDVSTNSFGGLISHPRIFGSRIQASLNVNVIQYRKSGDIEGSSGRFSFGQPLYSARTRWAWGTGLAWVNRMQRQLLPDDSGRYVPRMYRDKTLSWPDSTTPYSLHALPYEYHSRQLVWRTFVTRSFGVRRKANLSIGLEARQNRADAQGLIRQGYDPALVHSFEEKLLTRKNTRIGPYVSLSSHTNDFVSMFDLETLGLQEDVQVGPQIYTKVYAGSKRAMGTRDLVGVLTGLQYTAATSNALLRLWASHATEISPHHDESDGLIQGGLRAVSPRVAGIGRFVYDGGGLYHYQNALNTRYLLGGDSRLRGYPSKLFQGQHLVTSNLEFRTRSVKILEVMFGLIAFYDVGDAFDTGHLRPKHSAGLGGRATFPQFQRSVARLDLAFPLSSPDPDRNERYSPFVLWLTLEGQAFPFPSLESENTETPLLPEGS